MCGICGIVGGPRETAVRATRRMAAALAHRGPDDEGLEEMPHSSEPSGPVVTFGFRRLAILDLSPAGHQPMIHPTRGDVIVFNGEIYNFRELRKQLQLEGVVFRSSGDTEVVLQALAVWGEDAFSRLEGMFACGWYHARTRRVVLARDRHGIKPLYWTDSSHGFAFASEIKALHTLPWLDRRIDLRAVMSHLSLLCSTHDRTMFAAVRKLEPGHTLTVLGPGRFSIHRFAAPVFSKPITHLDRRSAAEACRDVFSHAIERQMVADVSVGGFLSGGLDSTAITSLARHHTRPGQEFPVYTVALSDSLQQRGDGFAEDLPYAMLVADALSVPITTVDIGDREIADVDGLVWHLDEPIADPAAMNVLRICSIASLAGVKVLLSGQGADDVFSGYRRHTALKMERLWRWWPWFAKRLLHDVSLALPSTMPLGRRLSRLGRDALLADDERLMGYFLWLDTTRVRSLLSPASLAAIGDWSPEEALRDTLATLPAGTHRLNRMLAIEQSHFLADHNLVYTDKMSMAHGVEVRVPFLDDQVVDFAAKLPPAIKHRGWTGKSVLRDAVAQFVPPETLHRPKTGFGVNLRRLINDTFSKRLHEIIATPPEIFGEIFDTNAIQSLVRANAGGQVDAAYTLFAVLCIESWCRQFRATW